MACKLAHQPLQISGLATAATSNHAFNPAPPPSNACLNCRYVYERVAAAHLGKSSGRLGLLGAGEWLRAKGHAIRSQFAAAQGALQLVALQEQARRDAVDSAALGEAALEEYMRQRMGKACLHQAIPFCRIESLLHGGTILHWLCNRLQFEHQVHARLGVQEAVPLLCARQHPIIVLIV